MPNKLTNTGFDYDRAKQLTLSAADLRLTPNSTVQFGSKLESSNNPADPESGRLFRNLNLILR